MASGRHITKRARRAQCKAITLLAVMVLTAGLCIGGTAAWLISVPEPVVNTFTYGDIEIQLTETDTGLDTDGKTTTNTYKMVPGQVIMKDPIITVIRKSEAMWLFVKLEKSANFDEFMEYTIDDTHSWTALDGVENVYYLSVSAEEIADTDLTIPVLKDNKVVVRDTVTKDMLNGLDQDADGNMLPDPVYPTLTITAYAVQQAGIDSAVTAWEKVVPGTAAP